MKRGFTLVEIMITMGIVVFLSMSAIAIINPRAQIARANDARRKRDLAKIKVAFEEYFNDRGCYPSDTSTKDPNLVSDLMLKANCNSGVFGPWLTNWPCDPRSREPYYIHVEQVSGDDAPCPHWFTVYANLENHKDKDIPQNFYTTGTYVMAEGDLTRSEANYGVSSSNVNWYTIP